MKSQAVNRNHMTDTSEGIKTQAWKHTYTAQDEPNITSHYYYSICIIWTHSEFFLEQKDRPDIFLDQLWTMFKQTQKKKGIKMCTCCQQSLKEIMQYFAQLYKGSPSVRGSSKAQHFCPIFICFGICPSSTYRVMLKDTITNHSKL